MEFVRTLLSPGLPLACLSTITLSIAGWIGSPAPEAMAQDPEVRYGNQIPRDVRIIYDRGLRYLIEQQLDNGNWPGGYSAGVTGLCLMALLADGEDPNFGKYNLQVRKAVEAIIKSQDATTGYIPNSMYCHGFSTLALAEAYGAVDETQLRVDEQPRSRRPLGRSLELAVRCAVTAQKDNRLGGWRYSPEDRNADTSVSGAVLIGLLAARNAGIQVPDTCVDRALNYFRNSTSENGMVAYTGGIGGMGQSMNRSAIATLVYCIGKRKHWKEFNASLGYIGSQLEHTDTGYPFYFRYYMSQALFQGDSENWTRWKRENTRVLKEIQRDDGSFEGGQAGPHYSTAMALLSLAVEFRSLPIYER